MIKRYYYFRLSNIREESENKNQSLLEILERILTLLMSGVLSPVELESFLKRILSNMRYQESGAQYRIEA